MTESMDRLLNDLKRSKNIETINHLIELGVLDMDTLIKSMMEKDDLDLYCLASAIKDVPLGKIIKAMIDYPVTDENTKKKKWDYLTEVFETIPNDYNGEILKVFIVDAKEGGYSKTLLPLFLHDYSKYEKSIDVIIDSQDLTLIYYSLRGSKYQDERLMSAFIQYANNTTGCGERLFDAIINADVKYTSVLVMRMASLFDESFLRILLAPKCLEKIEASLELESNNLTYLKFLNDFLDREITQLENSQKPICYLQKPTEYHRDYFCYQCQMEGPELPSQILENAKSIMKKLAEIPNFIVSLDETDRFQYLVGLYQRKDFETIRDNRELFKELFEETQGMGRK